MRRRPDKYYSPSGGKSRSRHIPPPQWQMDSLAKIVDSYEWSEHFILKLPEDFHFDSEKKLVGQILQMLATRLHDDGLKGAFGFLIKREYTLKSGVHYHVGTTCLGDNGSIQFLPATTVDKLKKNYLRMLGEGVHGSRFGHKVHRNPEDRARLASYLKKRVDYTFEDFDKKGKKCTDRRRVNVVNIPREWDASLLSPNIYHTRGLSHSPKKGAANVPTSRNRSESKRFVPCVDIVTQESSQLIPYSRTAASEEINRASSEKVGLRINAVKSMDRASFSKEKSTRSKHPTTTKSEQKSTRSNSGNPHVETNTTDQKSTRFYTTTICETCLYHGEISIKHDNSDTCPTCGIGWDYHAFPF